MAKGFKKSSDIESVSDVTEEYVSKVKINKKGFQKSSNMAELFENINNKEFERTVEPVKNEPTTVKDNNPVKTIASEKVTEAKANRTTKKALIIVAASVVIISAAIIGFLCVKNSDMYMHSVIDSGDASKLSELYKSKYSSNYSKEQEFLNKIYEYLEQMCDDYNNGTITYSEAENTYNGIQSEIEKNSIQGAMIGEYRERLYALKESKESYQQGLTYLKQNEYPKAIEAFCKVNSIDINYADSQKKVTEAKEAYRQYILNEANSKLSAADYQGAIQLLEGGAKYFSVDTVISEKLVEAKNALVNNAIKNAESDFVNVGYEKAIADIENALTIVGDNSVLNNALEKYKEYIPLQIYDTECSEKSKKNIQRTPTGTDNTNATHKNVLYAYHKGQGDQNQYEVYYLMGKYDLLTFEAYRNNADKTKTSDEVIKVNIYGDNALLESVAITKDFMPSTYSVNIEGVQKLKIEFESGWTDASQWWDVLPGAIANVVVAKTK